MRDFLCGIKTIIVLNERPILAGRDGYCGEQENTTAHKTDRTSRRIRIVVR